MSSKVNWGQLNIKPLECKKSNFFCRLMFISCHWWKHQKSDFLFNTKSYMDSNEMFINY